MLIKFCSMVAAFLTVVFGTAAVAQDSDKDSDKALYAALLQADALDNTYDSFIQPVLTMLLRDAELEEPFEINRTPRPGTLSVLVIDGKKLGAVASDNATVKRLLPNLTGNVLAIPPGTIVFDKSVIVALTVNAWDDGLQFSQALKAIEALGPRASREAMQKEVSKFTALADATRYHTIRNNRQNFNPDVSSATLLPKLLKELDYEGAGKPALQAFTIMLAPVVLHEIGHLRRGVAGAYQDALRGPLGAASLSLILQEENAADDFAIQRMRRVVRKAIDHHTHEQMTLEVLHGVATIKYMRDEVLEDTFGGFRGLNTEDLLISVDYWDCHDHKGIEVLPLNNPDRAHTAFRESFPLLTRTEFDEARAKIQRRIANGTHSHHFIRGDRYLAAFEHEKIPSFGLLAESLVFLDATVRNGPTRLYPDLDSTGTGLSFDKVKPYWLDVDVTPAVNCPDGMCAVVRFKDHAGFAEIVGPMNDLRRIRIVFQLLGPNPANREENSEEYLKHIMLGLRLVHSVVNDTPADAGRGKTKGPPQSSTTLTQQLLTGMRAMQRQCGAGYVGLPIGKRFVSIRTLNEQGWVAIDVTPLPPTTAPGGTPKGKRK